MYTAPRRNYFLLVEYRPEMNKTIVHDHVDAENELEAHREAKKYVEQNHNVHIRLLKCEAIGEYAYNSVLYPEDYKAEEGAVELETPDPQ